MPRFEEDPAHLPKSRLKSDLVAHSVALPPAGSKREVYVELHVKHVDLKNAAEFSSDEEDQAADKEEDPDHGGILDPSALSDGDLKAALLERGVKAGPIVASTRALYEKKLRKLLQADGPGRVNGVKKGVLYSDSEEEEDGPEGAKDEETVEQLDQMQQKQSQRPCTPESGKPRPKKKSGNVLKLSEGSSAHCSQIPVGISRAPSLDQRSGLGSGVPCGSQPAVTKSCSSLSSQNFSITQMVEEMERRGSLSSCTDTETESNGSGVRERWPRSSRLDARTKKNQSLYCTPEASPYKQRIQPPVEPVKDILKDMFPVTRTSPTGIYATCRKPIRGAAGRPVQYAYPDPPVTPTTLERQEVERRLMPIHIQILVFLAVVVLLYLINVCVEDNSFGPLVALLDGLTQRRDSEEGLLLQAESQDTPSLSG